MERPAKEAAYHIIEVNSDMGGDIMMSPEILARMIERFVDGKKRGRGNPHPKKKRKLSAWNKFVKANSKKPRFIYRNGKLNLKKMGVAFRKTPAGKKRKR